MHMTIYATKRNGLFQVLGPKIDKNDQKWKVKKGKHGITHSELDPNKTRFSKSSCFDF